MIGREYGKLTVVARKGSNKFGHPLFFCKCKCGSSTVAKGADLRAGGYKSCGCLKRTQGHNGHVLGEVWRGMLKRCKDHKSIGYKNYGGRGITVCDRWMTFSNFVEDMYPSFKKGLTLDRIDNETGYCAENCRWATWKQQQRNTRRNRFLTLNGMTKCISEWSQSLGIPKTTIWNRLHRGWSVERALTA